MTSFFQAHYWLAIAVAVVASLVLVFGWAVPLTLATEKARGVRRAVAAWLGASVGLGMLAIPAMLGAHHADLAKDAAIRQAVISKYAVTVDKWGAYSGRHNIEQTSLWRIDGENVTCTMPAMDDPEDRVLLVCGGHELPRRGA